RLLAREHQTRLVGSLRQRGLVRIEGLDLGVELLDALLEGGRTQVVARGRVVVLGLDRPQLGQRTPVVVDAPARIAEGPDLAEGLSPGLLELGEASLDL